MSTLLPSRTLSIGVDRPPLQVYAFIAAPENLPLWAAGLGGAVSRRNGGWEVETVRGPVGLRFTEANSLGVLDHVVTLAGGVEVYVPLRVVPNGSGSEVLFTLFRSPEMTDAQFAADAAAVERDLRTLKELLERA
jgi:hypothetical protein